MNHLVNTETLMHRKSFMNTRKTDGRSHLVQPKKACLKINKMKVDLLKDPAAKAGPAGFCRRK